MLLLSSTQVIMSSEPNRFSIGRDLIQDFSYLISESYVSRYLNYTLLELRRNLTSMLGLYLDVSREGLRLQDDCNIARIMTQNLLLVDLP